MGKRDQYRAERLRGEPDPSAQDEHSCPGTIVTVFPNDYACRVRDDVKGAEYDVAVPGLIQDSEGSGGEVYIPRVGQRVELKLGGATRPRIRQFLPQTFDTNVTGNETPPLFDGDQPNLNLFGNAPNNFRGQMPSGLMSGDWCRVGNLGQHIGVFDGGVTVLHGSKWAQIRAVGGQGADTLSLFGRRMNFHTDFGDIKFGSEGGKSFVEFLGGTDQTLESGVDHQNWTVKAAIGKGEGIANFAIMDRSGNAVYKTVISPDGTVSKTQAGDSADIFTGDQSKTYERAFARSVLNGDDTVTVENGDRVEDYLGNQFTNIDRSRDINVLGDDNTIVGGRIYRSCKIQDVEVAGRLMALPGDSAATWKVSNGSLDIEIGKPPTDLNVALSSFNVTVFPAGGNVTLTSYLGNIETYSMLQTKIDSAAEIAMSAGASFSAKSIGLMELKANAAMMIEAGALMEVKSKGPATFGSDTLVQLGKTGAFEPVVKGLTFLTSLATFLGACSAAGKIAGSPATNGAAIATIGAGADIMMSMMSNFPSIKVMTE